MPDNLSESITPSARERLNDLLLEALDALRDIDVSPMLPPGQRTPMQPIVLVNGVARFKENRIVSALLDRGPLDMNRIAMLPNITREEHAQFAQLIGYSVSGYSELSYAIDAEVAQQAVEALMGGNR